VKVSKGKNDLSRSLRADTCREITHIEDSDIGGQGRKSLYFASSEVARRSGLSIEGGQVAEI
jgi:hypothetical protein